MKHLMIIACGWIAWELQYCSDASAKLAKSANINKCKQIPVRIHKKIYISGIPSFFFKVHPLGNEIALNISHPEMNLHESRNEILNINKLNYKVIPGNLDPVYTPDGKYISIPRPIGFYSTLGIENKEKPDFFSQELVGSYQSIGMKNNFYYMITDHQKISLYVISQHNQKLELKNSIKLCENLKNDSNDLLIDFDLPMISRDAEFLSILNNKTQTTQIYRILMDKQYHCELFKDLGIKTGKVSFDYPRPDLTKLRIAFSVDHNKSDNELIISEFLNNAAKKDVQIMDLDIKSGNINQTVSITHNLNSKFNSYYPDFDSLGNLYFFQQDDSGSNAIHIALLSDIENTIECKNETSRPMAPTAILGTPYNQVLNACEIMSARCLRCHTHEFDINPVHAFWFDNQNNLKNIVKSNKQIKLPPLFTFNKKSTSVCPNMFDFNVERKNINEYFSSLYQVINTKYMPSQGNLNHKEQQTLLKFLLTYSKKNKILLNQHPFNVINSLSSNEWNKLVPFFHAKNSFLQNLLVKCNNQEPCITEVSKRIEKIKLYKKNIDCLKDLDWDLCRDYFSHYESWSAKSSTKMDQKNLLTSKCCIGHMLTPKEFDLCKKFRPKKVSNASECINTNFL